MGVPALIAPLSGGPPSELPENAADEEPASYERDAETKRQQGCAVSAGTRNHLSGLRQRGGGSRQHHRQHGHQQHEPLQLIPSPYKSASIKGKADPRRDPPEYELRFKP